MAAGYELVIVGGGPAGLSTALHLHACAPRLAARTLILERARYPREKHCAGAIAARAIVALHGIGVDAGVAPGGALPAVRVDGFEVELGGSRVRVREPAGAWVIRRDAFDARLADEVQRRGVALRQDARVRSIDRDARGVTLTLLGGERILARAVVGADGITGVVRRAIGLPPGALRAQAVEVDTERVPGDPPADTMRFVFRPELRGYAWDFPTPLAGGIKMSRGVYLLRDQRDEPGAPQAQLRAHLAATGLQLAGHRVKQLAERGWDPRAPMSVPRIVLVGEAAGIDFPTGEGIAQAILHGACAAPYLARALASDQLAFTDWRACWAASDEGRFLRQRRLAGRVLFSGLRAPLERALVSSPAIFGVALGRFAGRAIGRRELAAAGAQLVRALGAEAISAARS